MNVNAVDGIVVGFCGMALLLSIYIGQEDLAQTIAIGLIGYIGGSSSAKAKAKARETGEE